MPRAAVGKSSPWIRSTATSVTPSDPDFLRPSDHVVVGQDVSGFVEDDSGSETGRLPARAGGEKELIPETPGPDLLPAENVHAHHRWSDAFGGPGQGGGPPRGQFLIGGFALGCLILGERGAGRPGSALARRPNLGPDLLCQNSVRPPTLALPTTTHHRQNGHRNQHTQNDPTIHHPSSYSS